MNNFIHQTDIFHPHGDPDDHWDLATVYALAGCGALNLRGVMLDYPPAHRKGDPATLAMAQLGHLTGITGTPFVIGAMCPMSNRKDDMRGKAASNRTAAEWLCRVLESSQEQIVINIVGSCTDVALAGLLRPDLFKSKCKAVYLNAGAAYPGRAGELEYNVRLNPASYAAIFDLPCPVYWCPCWHQAEMRAVGVNGTWYSFVQEEVFSHLSDPLCNYFLYMLDRSSDPKYLRYLAKPADPELRARFGRESRNMWSTASILHAAGMGVDIAKGLLPFDQIREPLYEFEPLEIACADDGTTTWRKADRESNRHIFHIRHPDRYSDAMMEALRHLLTGLDSPNKQIHLTVLPQRQNRR